MSEMTPSWRLSAAEIIAALAAALSGVGTMISLAALVFTGPLEEGLPRAAGAFIVGGAIVAAAVAWRSAFVPVSAIVQDGPAVVMVAVGAGVAARGSENAATEVIVLAGLITVVTAVCLWFVGRFGLGNLVRYIPNTVVAAFIAGTGYLLLKGGLDVMVGFSVDRNSFGDFLSGDAVVMWLPGLVLGLLVWFVGRSDRLPEAAIGAVIVASVLGFYLIVALTSSVQAVEDGGWLIGPFADGAGPAIITPDEVSNVAWGDIGSDLPGIISLVAVAIISMLLNVSGLEFVRGGRVDVDKELRDVAGANLLIAPFGALPGFHALGDSVLLEKMGATRRVVPMIGAALMAAFGVFGASVVGFVPRLIVGALLATIGISLLVEWVEGLVRSIGIVERLLSIGIVSVIAFVGILEGIAAGVIAACAVFVFRYSRINPVRRVGSGREMKSRVDRTPSEAAMLAARADRIAVYQLQGYLFFGSLTTLEDQVRQRCSDEGDDLDAVLFDFRQVTGIDTSGYALIAQLVQTVQDVEALFVVSGLEDSVRESLVASEPDAARRIHWCDTLDGALEFVEQFQLNQPAVAGVDRGGKDGGMSEQLIAEFDEVNFKDGAIVMAQDAASDSMIVVQSGTLTAFRVDEDGKRHRMRRFGQGAMIGEIGLITGGTRSADVIADSAVQALSISIEQYENLRRDAPELCFELHEFILRVQAERVRSLSLSLADALR